MGKRYGFIVEGFNDEVRMKEVFPNSVIVVMQAKYTRRTRMNIEAALPKVDEMFILTDPDSTGDQFADWINKDYDFKRLFVDVEECRCYRNHKHKIGVEHASVDYLKNTLLQQIGGF